MADLDHLSRVGFGCYRVTVGNQTHYEALHRALSLGCNLIDTSATYTDGRSEALIGQVLSEHPGFDPFVITKAGYIEGSNLRMLEELNASGIACEGVARISESFKYSIHPEFLERQISLSLARLRRTSIDGFLLHNPEHFFDQPQPERDRAGYYDTIRKAFTYLEELARAETVRFYGVSSNTLPLSTEQENSTSLHELLRIAEDVSSDHHFRLIEFPYNFFERGAATNHHGGTSLLALARASGIITFSNRPLNAITTAGPRRLATYEAAVNAISEDEGQRRFNACVELIGQRLRESGSTDTPMDFTVMSFLHDMWPNMDSTDAVDRIFTGHYYPFLHALYGAEIPEQDLALHRNLHECCSLFARRRMTESANTIRHYLVERELVAPDDTRSLPVIACSSYLAAGIDHVLVGMRQPQYVDALSELFEARLDPHLLP